MELEIQRKDYLFSVIQAFNQNDEEATCGAAWRREVGDPPS
jgi:hypothetical protein